MIFIPGCRPDQAQSHSQNWIKIDTKFPKQPRILFQSGREADVRKGLESENSLAILNETVLNEATKLLEAPALTYQLKGRRLLEVSREAYRRIMYLAYAWRMTGDNRFKEKAERDLQTISYFPDWNPSHFLDVAEMTTAAAIGYDWLFNDLTADSKKLIADAIIEKGLKPSLLDKHNKNWIVADTNWGQVCHAGMGLGALAIFEHNPELSAFILNRTIANIHFAMQAYEPNGNYPEGYGYWGYGTMYNVLLLASLEGIFKTDFRLYAAHPGFQRTPVYVQNMIGTSGLPFNYSDNQERAVFNPAMFWFAAKQQNPSLLVKELEIIRKGKNLHRIKEIPAALVWGAALNFKNIKPPDSLFWWGKGENEIITMRTDWINPNGWFVGVKGGTPGANHGHMDVGSLVVDFLGERWASDLEPQSYGELEKEGVDLWSKKQNSERWSIFRLNNLSHNTLVINGAPQRVSGKVTFTELSQRSDFLSAFADLTPVYEGQVAKIGRRVSLRTNKFLLIEDSIVAGPHQAVVTWQWLTKALITLAPDGKSAILSLNGKQMYLHLVSPKGTFKQWIPKPNYDYETPVEGFQFVGLEVIVPPGQAGALVIVFTSEATLPKSFSFGAAKD